MATSKAKGREQLPDQLRRLIRDGGHTGYGLAKLCGVDKVRIGRWLKGERDLTAEAFGRLAEAVGVEPLRASRRRPAKPSAPRRDPRSVFDVVRGDPGPAAGDP